MKTETIQLDNARAEIFCFETNSEVKEFHVMIHAIAEEYSFQQQLDAVLDCYQQLSKQSLKGATAVFKR